MVRLRDITTQIPQPIRFGLRRLYYSGSGATCVLCGNGVHAFVSPGGGAEVLDRRKVVGSMRRENDRCPISHGCDRTRMMMLWLEQAGIEGGPRRILHIAPDLGLYLWLRGQDGVEYVGSDIDAAHYRHIENMHAADLTRMPFLDDDLDIVICSHVLEHVPDDATAMRENPGGSWRLGGRALLLTPYAHDGKGTDEDPAERNRQFGQWDKPYPHLRSRGFPRTHAAGGLRNGRFRAVRNLPRGRRGPAPQSARGSAREDQAVKWRPCSARPGGPEPLAVPQQDAKPDGGAGRADPAISVVIPHLGQPELLRRCLRSLARPRRGRRLSRSWWWTTARPSSPRKSAPLSARGCSPSRFPDRPRPQPGRRRRPRRHPRLHRRRLRYRSRLARRDRAALRTGFRRWGFSAATCG